VVSSYSCECDFIYSHKDSSLAAPIFTKVVNAEHHYVQISYAEFRTNRTVSTESSDTHSFTSLRKVWLSHWDDFHQTANDNGNFYRVFCTTFCLNLVKLKKMWGQVYLNQQVRISFHQFHATHFTPQISFHQFHATHVAPQIYFEICFTLIYPHRWRNIESTGCNLFSFLSEVWLPLSRFSWKSRLLDKCM
jgi:hypothetical protein